MKKYGHFGNKRFGHQAQCIVDEANRATPAYDLAVTHKNEMWAIFKRLWKFKEMQPQRDEHLAFLNAYQQSAHNLIGGASVHATSAR